MTDPLFQRTADNQVYHYQNDHLGTPQRQIKSNGATVWRATYTAFGEASISADSTVENNLRFPGQYYDEESTLHHNYFRDYDPHTGRYVQTDPIGLRGGLNIYVYSRNTPISYSDPLGLDAIPIIFPDYRPALPRDWPFVAGKRPVAAGHAGILIYDSKTGLSRYYEYGRYSELEGECGCGAVRNYPVPNLKVGDDGKPTAESLNAAFSKISKESGGGTRILAAHVSNADFKDMDRHGRMALAQNNNPNRAAYNFTRNNCGHFMLNTLEAGGVEDLPWIVNPSPSNMMDELHEEGYPPLTWPNANR